MGDKSSKAFNRLQKEQTVDERIAIEKQYVREELANNNNIITACLIRATVHTYQ